MLDLGDRHSDGRFARSEAPPLDAQAADMALFTIGFDDDDDDDDDDDEDDAPGKTRTPGDESVLASRLSQIISGYRNYLSETETVAGGEEKNQQPANDDANVPRDSPGVHRGRRRGDRPPPEPEAAGPPTDADVAAAAIVVVRGGADMQRRERETTGSHRDDDKFSRWMLRSHHPPFGKKRVVACMTCLLLSIAGMIVVAVVVAFDSASAKSSSSAWDEGMAEKEMAEAMREGGTLRGEWKEKGLQFFPPTTTSSTSTPEDERDEIRADKSPAMEMIEAIIAHPEDVTTGGVGGTSKSGKGEGAAAMSLSGIGSHGHSGVAKPAAGIGKSGKSGSGKSTKAASTTATATPPMSHQSATSLSMPSGSFGRQSSTGSPAHGHHHHLEGGLAAVLYRQAVDARYGPRIYDGSGGWGRNGHEYADAAVHCALHYPPDGDRVGVPCPLEAYCPEGPGGPPYGGLPPRSGGGIIGGQRAREEGADDDDDATAGGGDRDRDRDDGVAATYAPILDESSSSYRVGWVQLGGGGRTCVARDRPTPEPSAEQIGVIMCCRDVDRR
jgi:hypothetical protein